MKSKLTDWWSSRTSAQRKAALAAFVAGAIAIFAALGVTVPGLGSTPADPQTGPTASTGPVSIPSPTSSTSTTTITPDGDRQITEADKRAAAGDDTIAAHEDQVDEQPAGAPAHAAEQVQEAANATPTTPQPVAGAQNYSCKWKPVVNFSSRSSKAIQFVVHETVSRPGTLMAIWRLFNTPSFGASSTYIMEVSGRCLQIISRSKKPWTQGAFNSASISVELVAPAGSTRSWWMKQPVIKRGILASLIRDDLKRMGSPLRWVDPVGCTPRAGWTDHEHLECGNDHCDVTGCDKFPRDFVQRQIASGVSSPTSRTINYPRRHFGPQRRAQCKQLAIVRKNAKYYGGWTLTRRTAARELINELGGKKAAARCKFV